jgi:hypothetical protein
VKPGDKFGRLTVLSVFKPKGGGKKRASVECRCGTRKNVQCGNLLNGHTTSCGCCHSERVRETHTIHGARLDNNEASPTYHSWRTMIRNCRNKGSKRYADYGGLGITVCARWSGKGGFQNFLADMGERPEDHQLSRRDKSKGFTPSNTYWATVHETSRNTRRTTLYTVGNRTQCLSDWAAEHGIPKNTLHYRVVTRGMTMRDALDVGEGMYGKPLPE